MKKILYVLFTIVSFTLFVNNANALLIDRDATGLGFTNDFYIEDLNKEYKVVVKEFEGNLKFKSYDEDIFVINNEGVITAKKDGVGLLRIKDDLREEDIFIMITAYGTIYKELEEHLNSLGDSISYDFVKDFVIYNKEGAESNWIVGDYIYNGVSDIENNIYVELDADFENDTVKVTPSKSFQYNMPDGESIYWQSIKYNRTKELKMTFANSNEKNAAFIKEFSKDVKEKYNSILNETYADMFSTDNLNNQELMLKATSLYKKIKDAGLDYKIDARKGDNTPGQAMYGAFIMLGKNGVYYGAVEVEIYQVLLIPTIKNNKNLIDAIKEYFEEKLLNDDEKVEIEKIEDNTYRAIISKKNNSTLLSLISNFLLPRVFAEDKKVVEFTVEQTDEEIKTDKEDVKVDNKVDNIEKTPATGDMIYNYLLLGIISLISIKYLLKKLKHNKKRTLI